MSTQPEVPPVCLYGCPEIDFREDFRTLEQARQDLATARDAGISAAGCGALEARIEEVKAGIQRDVDGIRAEHPGPWKMQHPEGQDRQIVAAYKIACCRIAGYTFVGSGGTARAERPA